MGGNGGVLGDANRGDGKLFLGDVIDMGETLEAAGDGKAGATVGDFNVGDLKLGDLLGSLSMGDLVSVLTWESVLTLTVS